MSKPKRAVPEAAKPVRSVTRKIPLPYTRGPDLRHVLSTPDELADAINQELAAAKRDGQSAVAHALKAGQYLSDAKAKVGHGRWLYWLKEKKTGLSERTAQAYMQLAERWPDLVGKDPQRAAEMPLRQALALIAKKPEQRDQKPSSPKAGVPGDRTAKRVLATLDALEVGSVSDPLGFAEKLRLQASRFAAASATLHDASTAAIH